MRRKAGRNSWPHSEMQWASSIVISDTRAAVSSLRSLAASRRSGEQKSRSRVPPAMSASVRCCDGFGCCEVREAARNPSFRARSTWSCMREMSGLTTITRPSIMKAGSW